MGLAAAAAFVVSTVQFPLLGLPVHLGLYGLLGVVLRGRAFAVVYVCLLFQSLMLQQGGLLSLGLNALNMGLGAMAGRWVWVAASSWPGPAAAGAGFTGALVPALLLAVEFELAEYGKGFYVIASLYSAVALAEAAVTVFACSFLRRVRPDLLQGGSGLP